MINAFFDGRNYMMLSAPQNRLYWFLFKEMSKATGGEIPRFTKDDEIALAREHFSDQLTGSTTFGDVYGNRLHTALVALEEHVFERWHFGRIITIGDSAHKVHPNTAQGGNGAIETATVLLNALLPRLSPSDPAPPPPPSDSDIEAVFAEVQAARFGRAAATLEQGRRTSWLSMRDTLASRIFVHYLFRWFGNRIITWFVVRYAETGPVIEGLPLPCRNGVTLPHAGTAAKPRGGKIPWGLGALGAALVVALVYTNRGPGWPDFVTTAVMEKLGQV